MQIDSLKVLQKSLDRLKPTNRLSKNRRATGGQTGGRFYLTIQNAYAKIWELRSNRAEANMCGCSSIGRTSPCQGEGREFEPHRPLSSKLIPQAISALFIRRRGQVARQESAKLSSWVQIPSSPFFAPVFGTYTVQLPPPPPLHVRLAYWQQTCLLSRMARVRVNTMQNISILDWSEQFYRLTNPRIHRWHNRLLLDESNLKQSFGAVPC